MSLPLKKLFKKDVSNLENYKYTTEQINKGAKTIKKQLSYEKINLNTIRNIIFNI
jgi:hypothetical protein